MPATPPRDFPDIFGVGDEVSIVRTEHGWFDGGIGGEIVELSKGICVVKVTEGEAHMLGNLEQIRKPRDIRLVAKARSGKGKRRR